MNKPINRRDFLKQTAKPAPLAGLGGGGPLLQGCSAKKAYDTVIVDALGFDGQGGPPVEADIGIVAETIQTIGKIKPSRGKLAIEAKGLAISPGFIAAHDPTAVR